MIILVWYSPSRFGDDHFCAEFIKFFPELLGLELTRYGLQVLAVSSHSQLQFGGLDRSASSAAISRAVVLIVIFTHTHGFGGHGASVLVMPGTLIAHAILLVVVVIVVWVSSRSSNEARGIVLWTFQLVVFPFRYGVHVDVFCGIQIMWVQLIFWLDARLRQFTCAWNKLSIIVYSDNVRSMQPNCLTHFICSVKEQIALFESTI